MRSAILLLSYIFVHTLSYSQNIQWAQKVGNTHSDKIITVKSDKAGYIYISGYFSDSIQIGTNNVMLPFVAVPDSKEAFIAKLDSGGFCYWAKAGGQYYDDRVLGMDVDSMGNSVIVGTFWEGSGIDFPPINITGSTYGYADQGFILKLNTYGTPLWGKYVCSDGFGDDQAMDVAIDRKGNIYTVGFMTNDTLYCGGNTVTAVNCNPSTDVHKYCYWLTKQSANGTFQWAKTFGSLPWDPTTYKYVERDIAVCVDNKDGVYITGGFDSTRAFGTDTFTTYGDQDVFVMKYDTSGVFKWATQAGSDKDDWCNGICSDEEGSIYITGEHRDSLIMDTVLVKNYDKRDLFIFKIDATSGKPLWGKRAGSDLGSERGNDVWADDKCNVYVCGDINEGAKFGDSITLPLNGLGVQSFVARITPQGKWKWVTTGGGVGDEDRANGLVKGKGKQLYLAGFFRNQATYGTAALTSSGSSDGYLARLYDSMYTTTCTPTSIEEVRTDNAFLSDPVPNPSSGDAAINFALPKGEQKGTITLYSITGQLIQAYPVTTNNNTLHIDHSDLPSGIYMYQLRTASSASELKKMSIAK
jgi:hypothetical protein